jgi:DNA-binding GntR family transcriptional regulator
MRRRVPSEASLADEAYSIVRRRILRGELAMGEALSRRQLATELGMSFLPVSEALLRLEHEGLLESRPRAGTRIRIPSREDVLGNYVVREALEVQAATLFTARATDRDCQEMMKLALRIDQGVAAGNSVAYARLHHKFHRRIAEVTKCDALVAAIDRNNALASVWFCLHPVGHTGPGPGRHESLVDALISRDASAAAAAVRQHLDESLRHTMPLLETSFDLEKSASRTYIRKTSQRRASNASGTGA